MLSMRGCVQVKRAEEAQRQSEEEMADLLSKTVETELSKQHAERSREINALQVCFLVSLVCSEPISCIIVNEQGHLESGGSQLY